MTDEEKGKMYEETMEDKHTDKSLVLGKDHCGFCYDSVMDLRSYLADSMQEDIYKIIAEMDEKAFPFNDSIYSAAYKITKLIRGD